MSERPYGVLGRVLGHSYTPKIYNMLAGLDYVRFEREPDQVEAFLKGDEWQGRERHDTLQAHRDALSR